MKVISGAYLMKVISGAYLMKVISGAYLMKVISGAYLFTTKHIILASSAIPQPFKHKNDINC
jgi:hypothetical protein